MRHRQVGKARPWETQPEGLREKKNTLKGWDMSKVPGAISGTRKEGRETSRTCYAPKNQ